MSFICSRRIGSLSFPFLFLFSNSLTSFRLSSGFLSRYYVTDLVDLAIVSDPAKILLIGIERTLISSISLVFSSLL